jgi:hypothetical protein
MIKRQKPLSCVDGGLLTRDTILYAVEKPKGHALLVKFLEQMRDGTIPATQVTSELASVFRDITEKGVDPLVALGLNRVRGGKSKPSAASVEKRDLPIVNFIADYLEKDFTKGNLNRAVQAASERFHKTDRRIEQIWEQHRDMFLYCRRAAKRHAEKGKSK